MPSDLPLSFHKIIRNAWKSISLSRPQHERNLNISPPSRFTRIRWLMLAQNHGYDRLPLYASAIEMETVECLPRSRLSLSKTIVSLTFQAALAMLLAMSASQDHLATFGAAMVIAFAASVSGMFMKHSSPRVAAIFETIGYLSFATGFFVKATVFFNGSLIMWIIGRLAWASTMLTFLIAYLT